MFFALFLFGCFFCFFWCDLTIRRKIGDCLHATSNLLVVGHKGFRDDSFKKLHRSQKFVLFRVVYSAAGLGMVFIFRLASVIAVVFVVIVAAYTFGILLYYCVLFAGIMIHSDWTLC